METITNAISKVMTLVIVVSLFVIFTTIATLLLPVVWLFIVYRIMTVLASCLADEVL